MADPTTAQECLRVLVGTALCFAIGFERQLRGSPAGDRSFGLIGLGGALIGLLASRGAPAALTGAITGIGFIGGAVTAHVSGKDGRLVRGITTATTILVAAVIGASAGQGLLVLATVATGTALLLLELRHLPVLKLLDASRWAKYFADDDPPHADAAVPPVDTGEEPTVPLPAASGHSLAERAERVQAANAAAAGAADGAAVDAGPPETGSPDAGTPDAPGDSAPGDSAPGDSAPGDGAPGDGAPT